MKRVNRRVPFLLLILVLLLAPVANAWCGTVCVAAAISTGCAHGLQPIDDLPVAKAVVAVGVEWAPVEFSTARLDRVSTPAGFSPAQRTPLRI